MRLADNTNTYFTGVAEIPGIKALWAKTLGNPYICIALLDGPVDRSHPAFAGARLALARIAGPSTDWGLALRHGTQVASIIFGQHNGYIRGQGNRAM